MSINQLKLNTNAVVDNVNLINLVHDPAPIVYQKPVASGNAIFRPSNDYFNVNGRSHNFEFIDENKLSMYSFLVQRDLKMKQWLSDYQLNNSNENEEPVKLPKEVTKKESKKIINSSSSSNIVADKDRKLSSVKSFQSTNSNITLASTSTNSNHALKKPILINKNVNSEIEDLIKCCDDSVRAIEFMEKQLNEFKNDRLKIVFNDPNQEEKHKRIQLEQIKYLSRSLYNLQNQIGKFKNFFSTTTSASSVNSNSKLNKTITPITRLIHAMRQVNKLVYVFSNDLYPYRGDNDSINDKLYLHFYKQLSFSISNFNECINTICMNNFIKLNDQFNLSKSQSIAFSLVKLMANCEKFFDEFNHNKSEFQNREENLSNQTSSNKSDNKIKNKTNAMNVIRVSRRVSSIKSHGLINKNRKSFESKSEKMVQQNQNKVFDSIKTERSPSSNKVSFQQKRVKIARLFPSRQITTDKPIKSILNTRKIPLESIENKKESNKNDWYSMEELQTIKKFNDMGLLDQERQSLNRKAFDHVSSTKPTNLRSSSDEKIIKKKSRSISNERQSTKSRSRSNSSYNTHSNINSLNDSRSSGRSYYSETDQTFEDDLNTSIDLEDMKLKYNNNLNQMRSPNRVDLKFDKKFSDNLYKKQSNRPITSNSSYISLGQSTRQLISRLDLIKKDNDEIKKKYENLNYEYQSDLLSNEKPNKRRYEELYLKKPAEFTVEYESKIDFNKVYKPLKEPSIEQVNRVRDYSKKFKDYYEKTSITTIGQSKFDDFELFEMLSDQLYDEYFNSIHNEIEILNDEISANLLNAEFELSKNDLNENVSLNHKPLSPRKSNKSISEYDYMRTVNENNSMNNSIHTLINENQNNNFNYSYSSFKTNKDEEESSSDFTNTDN